MKLIIPYTKLATAQAIIGFNFVMGKLLMPYFSIYLLCCLRFGIGALIMGAICYFKGLTIAKDLHGKSLNKHDWVILILQGACAGFLFNIFVLIGLKYTEASTAGVISSTTPAAIAVLSFFILKESLGTRQILSIGLAVLGILIIGIGDETDLLDSSGLFGDLLILIAVIPEALFTVLAKWYKTALNSYQISFIVCAVNALLFLPFALVSLFISLPILSWEIVGLLVFYGIIGSAGFFIFWYQGLQHVPASIAALFTAVMPVSSTLLGCWILNEDITLYDVVGMTLVLISILLGAVSFKAFSKKNLVR